MAIDSSEDDQSDNLELQFERLLSSSPTSTRLSTATNGPSVTRAASSQNLNYVSQAPRPSIVSLDVGGRVFKVSIKTLVATSGLFRHQFSTQLNWIPQRDGTYFLDRDPNLFEQILAFMRCPSTFPILYTKTDGFNYNAYNRLEQEAKYFETEPLYQWIKDKKYLSALTVRHRISVTQELAGVGETAFEGDVADEIHLVSQKFSIYLVYLLTDASDQWLQERVYLSPSHSCPPGTSGTVRSSMP